MMLLSGSICIVGNVGGRFGEDEKKPISLVLLYRSFVSESSCVYRSGMQTSGLRFSNLCLHYPQCNQASDSHQITCCINKTCKHTCVKLVKLPFKYSTVQSIILSYIKSLVIVVIMLTVYHVQISFITLLDCQ